MVHKRRLRENENKLIVAEAVAAVVVLIHKEVYESIPGHVSLVSDQ